MRDSYAWLKQREPFEQIGYSILVYDIRNDARAHNDLGVLFLQYSMLQEAVREFGLATKLDPTVPASHVNLGIAHSFRAEFNQAEKAFATAAELDPRNELARKGLVLVRSRKKGLPIPVEKGRDPSFSDR